MPLTGPQLQRIATAINAAYTREDLPRVVRTCMDVSFDDIAPNSGFEAQVFALVEWANRQERVLELLRCAADHNQGNTALYALWQELSEAAPSSAHGLQIEWIEVPAGIFRMGSDPAVDRFALPDEQPQHRLDLPAFRMAKYPITNLQYLLFVEAATYSAPAHWEDRQPPPGREDHPVVNVAWHDAVAFCQWASTELGATVTLPSEAEWEKTARGRDGHLWPWGNTPPTPALCNFANTQPGTTAVNQYRGGASPLGVMDMAGNVWEWTCSLWGPDTEQPQFRYPYATDDGREVTVAADDVYRVVRGGSFNNQAQLVRCAYRGWLAPYFANVDLGFRVVASPAVSVT